MNYKTWKIDKKFITLFENHKQEKKEGYEKNSENGVYILYPRPSIIYTSYNIPKSQGTLITTDDQA